MLENDDYYVLIPEKRFFKICVNKFFVSKKNQTFLSYFLIFLFFFKGVAFAVFYVLFCKKTKIINSNQKEHFFETIVLKAFHSSQGHSIFISTIIFHRIHRTKLGKFYENVTDYIFFSNKYFFYLVVHILLNHVNDCNAKR